MPITSPLLRTSPYPGHVRVLPELVTACGVPLGAGGTPHTHGAGWCLWCAHALSGFAEWFLLTRWWTRLCSCPHTPPAASSSCSVEPPGGLGSRWGGIKKECGYVLCFHLLENLHWNMKAGKPWENVYIYYSWLVGVGSMSGKLWQWIHGPGKNAFLPHPHRIIRVTQQLLEEGHIFRF